MNEVGGRPIPRTEKYTLGGARNMRGYNYEDIGPKMMGKNTDGEMEEFNLGGLFSLLGTLEFEHPLAREAGLKWVVFFDAGNVYSKYFGYNGNYDLYYDYGFGLRWFSPIGVLRFEFGYPLNTNVSDTGMKFHFDIGQVF
jgi:outer membrane protein insertion porin family